MKSLAIRLEFGLYELLEREALTRKISVSQVIIERLTASYREKSDGIRMEPSLERS